MIAEVHVLWKEVWFDLIIGIHSNILCDLWMDGKIFDLKELSVCVNWQIEYEQGVSDGQVISKSHVQG